MVNDSGISTVFSVGLIVYSFYFLYMFINCPFIFELPFKLPGSIMTVGENVLYIGWYESSTVLGLINSWTY